MICVDIDWAGVDSVWEQKKLEASLPKVVLAQGKILVNADDWAREQSTETTVRPD